MTRNRGGGRNLGRNGWANPATGVGRKNADYRPAEFYELDHIQALEAARNRPKVPWRIICQVCESVPRSKAARGRFRVSADGSGWRCPIHQKGEER